MSPASDRPRRATVAGCHRSVAMGAAAAILLATLLDPTFGAPLFGPPKNCGGMLSPVMTPGNFYTFKMPSEKTFTTSYRKDGLEHNFEISIGRSEPHSGGRK